jgi:hypothetical protein
MLKFPNLAARLLILVLAVTLTITGCPPTPQPAYSPGDAATVATWVDTSHLVVRTASWVFPAVRAVVEAVVPAPAAAVVLRLLDFTAARVAGFGRAVDAWVAAGGSGCAPHAAAMLVQVSLLDLAQGLVDAGLAVGATLERIFDAVGSVVDALIPACDRDAGFYAAGMDGRTRMRAIESRALQRGVILRRDLDNLEPLMDGGVR